MRSYRYHIITTLLLVTAPLSAQAALTLLSGPPTCTHVGNLVANGSFENGAPAPGTANKVYWATGTSLTPYAVPPSWTSSGAAGAYANWGDDIASPAQIVGADYLPDGVAGLYFGNGWPTFVNQPPTFHPDGRVTFPGAPVFVPKYGAPVVLSQTVPTNLTPAPNYCFDFWTSGETALTDPHADGIFGLRVTNVLPGDPIQYLTVTGGASALGLSHRYEFDMVPLNASLPITIEFYNWGHLDLTAFGGPNFTSELVLDDVMINAVPEPVSLAFLGVGCIALLRRRRRPCALFIASLASIFMTNRPAHAAFTQNTGAQIATPTGNLVTNGSFENGAPAPGYANQIYWATGTTNTPFAVPPGWTSSGQPSTYALWGSDAPAAGIINSDTIPDGSAALYFGNANTTVSPAPTYGPNHNVTFGSPPTFTPFYGGPSKLSQTVNTQLSPAPGYVLNFWVSGEDATINGFAQPGVFGLKVTNVLAGDPEMYFEVPNTSINPSFRLEFFFAPLNTSLPVTLEFTNWGHIDNNPNNGQLDATELVLDDVIINPVPEPASLLMLSVGGLLILKRRWRTTQYPS